MELEPDDPAPPPKPQPTPPTLLDALVQAAIFASVFLFGFLLGSYYDASVSKSKFEELQTERADLKQKLNDAQDELRSCTKSAQRK